MSPRSAPRKAILILVVALLGLSVPQAVSEESQPLPLKAEMTASMTGSLNRLYVSGDPSVVWKPKQLGGGLGGGIGAELIVGLDQFDIYLAPYLRGEWAWVHLDLGYILPIIKPVEEGGLAGGTMGMGMTPHPFDLGFGRLGFELAVDFNLRTANSFHPTTAGLERGTRLLLTLLAAGRLGIGVTYAFGL